MVRFDQQGVHFVGLNNVQNLKAGGLGNLGRSSSNGWKTTSASDPRASRSWCSPTSRSGPSTLSGAGALTTGRRRSAISSVFGSVTVLNGSIHQIMQKVEGNVAFHTARSTAFPQPAPGTAPSPGPKVVPAGELRGLLGVTNVTYRAGTAKLAITDTALAG
jgi:3',5'-cyclic-AMP phosphodiesterase